MTLHTPPPSLAERHPWLPVGGLALLAAATIGLREPTTMLQESTGALLTVTGVFLGAWLVIQLAVWRTPLLSLIGRDLGPRQRLDFHRAMSHTATLTALVPLAALGIAWFRGEIAILRSLLELSALCLAFASLTCWLHNWMGIRYLHALDDARKRLSYVIRGWRVATGLNLLLHGLLWSIVWMEYSGGPSLSIDLQGQLTQSSAWAWGLIALIFAATWGRFLSDPSLRRVQAAQSVSVAATVVAMVEAWLQIKTGGSPLPIALFWTGVGVLLSVPLAGPDKGMFKPVGDIQLPIPLSMSGGDRLRSIAAGLLLGLSWRLADLPWVDLAMVGGGIAYLSWARVRRQRMEHLLTGQTRQLRKDKEKVEELNQVLAESFSKFVPRDLVEELVAEGQLVRLRGEEREVTILFSDIRGYSTIIETLPPIRVLKVLNLYFNSMEKVIDRHGGTILEYVGDAILAVFGAPGDLPNHAQAATLCAVEMRDALAEFNAEMERQGLSDTWRDQGYEQLGARIGVHMGHVVAGTLGGTNQVRYSVLGDTVNVAARLEAYNKELGTEILISDAVFEALDGQFEQNATDHGPISLKGRSAAQRCYSL